MFGSNGFARILFPKTHNLFSIFGKSKPDCVRPLAGAQQEHPAGGVPRLQGTSQRQLLRRGSSIKMNYRLMSLFPWFLALIISPVIRGQPEQAPRDHQHPGGQQEQAPPPLRHPKNGKRSEIPRISCPISLPKNKRNGLICI